jgi:hypothetical protein
MRFSGWRRSQMAGGSGAGREGKSRDHHPNRIWCWGRRSPRRFPAGWSGPSSGWAASGMRSGRSGCDPGSSRPGWATAGGSRPIPRTGRFAAVAPVTPRWFSWSSIRQCTHTSSSCAFSSRAMTQRRGCGKGTTSARSTARPSARRRGSRPKRRTVSPPLRRVAPRGRLRHDRDGDLTGRGVLLRQALPPAVSRGQPPRQLRPYTGVSYSTGLAGTGCARTAGGRFCVSEGARRCP